MNSTGKALLLVLNLGACVVHGPVFEGTDNGFFSAYDSRPVRARLPLYVSSDDESINALLPAVEAFWMEQTGRDDLFTSTPENARVLVSASFTTEALSEADWTGEAEYQYNRRTDMITTCSIRIHQTTDTLSLLEHEMGHCFGLADDEGSPYIMNHTINPGADASPLDADLINTAL